MFTSTFICIYTGGYRCEQFSVLSWFRSSSLRYAPAPILIRSPERRRERPPRGLPLYHKPLCVRYHLPYNAREWYNCGQADALSRPASFQHRILKPFLSPAVPREPFSLPSHSVEISLIVSITIFILEDFRKKRQIWHLDDVSFDSVRVLCPGLGNASKKSLLWVILTYGKKSVPRRFYMVSRIIHKVVPFKLHRVQVVPKQFIFLSYSFQLESQSKNVDHAWKYYEYITR